MSSVSDVVRRGMKRVCADFSRVAEHRGFVGTRSRSWVRVNGLHAETIYLYRHGSTYGVPHTASISLRVVLGIVVLNVSPPGGGIGVMSDHARRPSGFAYHHRFNAETWSTYDRCLEELDAYLTEVGEPWFSQWRIQQKLLAHPELPTVARQGLESAISGKVIAEDVAASLKALGFKVPPAAPDGHTAHPGRFSHDA